MENRFKPYPSYKDSGVEWLGEIPEQWDIRRLKFAANIEAGQSPPSEIVTEGSDGLPFLQGNAEFGKLNPIPRLVCDNTPKRAMTGDILLSVRAPVGALNIADQSYGIGRGLCAIQIHKSLDLHFSYYLLSITRSQLDSVSTGSTYEAVTASDVGDLPILLPSNAEQYYISAFLDRETAKIDILVSKKERLIELLQEKRTALITQAVTKGLDPSTPMKDSGVDWLGKIPSSWEIIRLKYLVEKPLQYGANEAAELNDPDLPRFIRITDIAENGTLHEETFKSLAPDIAEPYLLREGDLLVARSGATVGKSFRYQESWGKACYAGYLIRASMDPRKVKSKFVSYFTSSESYKTWLSATLIQATIQNVSGEKYANLFIPLPDLNEQNQIIEFLERENANIDAIISKTHEAIDKLKEYRIALISAVVTGKIDVREEMR